VVFWKLNLMECVKKITLANKRVRNRNQRVCVAGWVGVWE